MSSMTNGNGHSPPVARGRWALVTGGSRGIGRAICQELAATGMNVALIYLSNDAAASATVAELEDAGVEARALRVDVAEPEQVSQAFASLDGARCRIDVLVNSAGINLDHTVAKLTAESWGRVIATNLTGSFNCAQAAVTRMREQGYGRIVNIASVIGQTGNVGQGNYAAAKAGIIGFTKALALETARHDITVNAVCPGFIETDMLATVPQGIRDEIVERIPKRRFGSPADVARLVGFLACTDSAYITGQQFNVNGGLYM
jgi:acetoacetyl-CoA reductase